MKKVEAVIPRQILEEVRDAVFVSDFEGMGIIDARGFNRIDETSPKSMLTLEFIVDSRDTYKVIDTISFTSKACGMDESRFTVSDFRE